MRKIKICATIPNLDGLKSWGKVHQELFETIKNPNVEIIMADLPKSKLKSVTSGYDATNIGFLHTELAIDAEKNGFDATLFYILSFLIPIAGFIVGAMYIAKEDTLVIIL